METTQQPTWDLTGGALWLDREQWGIVYDALIEHKEHSRSRKAINPASTSDIRADMCVSIMRQIREAAA